MARIYVIGPVTGREDGNIAAFMDARKQLMALGHDADLPHDFIRGGAPWEEAMRTSLRHLATGRADGRPFFDGVARLEGWQESRGAALESACAIAMGIRTMDLGEWLAMEGGE